MTLALALALSHSDTAPDGEDRGGGDAEVPAVAGGSLGEVSTVGTGVSKGPWDPVALGVSLALALGLSLPRLGPGAEELETPAVVERLLLTITALALDGGAGVGVGTALRDADGDQRGDELPVATSLPLAAAPMGTMDSW